MNLEEQTRKTYEEHGEEYLSARLRGTSRNLYNEFIEVPSMLNEVGNVDNHKLLDIGCGPGIHTQEYTKRGALVYGMDISETMIKLAREINPAGNFRVGNIYNIPREEFFDIVTASLMMFHVEHLHKAIDEVYKALKPGGRFIVSELSPHSNAREAIHTEEMYFRGFGHFRNKKTGQITALGNTQEGIEEVQLTEQIKIKQIKRGFGTYVRSLTQAGFQLENYQECHPTKELKEHDPEAYEILSKIPIYCIYSARKNYSTPSHSV